jgi:prepilin-type processing-associated H-X9-DG protein
MTDDLRIRPTAIRAPHGARQFSVTWADGHVTHLPHDLLRGYCPCAGCQGHSGAITFQEGRNLDLRDVQRVGNYALGLTWADGHSSGIYTFAFLRSLGDLVEEEGAQAVRERGTLPRLG